MLSLVVADVMPLGGCYHAGPYAIRPPQRRRLSGGAMQKEKRARSVGIRGFSVRAIGRGHREQVGNEKRNRSDLPSKRRSQSPGVFRTDSGDSPDRRLLSGAIWSHVKQGRSGKVTRWLVAVSALAVLSGTPIAGRAAVDASAPAPSIDTLTDYRPKLPLRVYTADHVLMGEFGEERRELVRLQDIPDIQKKAVLAIEDARFYEHGGVDFVGILRAGIADLAHSGSPQGASTLTMQLARNLFLSNERTLSRKLREMQLAYRIEHALTKDQILEMYMNQIFLGERAYGFAAAARVYFGKDLKNITLAEAAMLAGLPKAPSAYNPVVNPKRAKVRQEYILKRMLDLNYITQQQYNEAVKQELHTRTAGNEYSVHAEYVAEMVRQMMYARYKDETYTRGLNVVTTISSADQDAAYRAVRRGVMDYERRHGYRGPEGFMQLPPAGDQRDEAIDDALSDHPDNDEIVAAVVTSATPKEVNAQLRDGTQASISGDGLRFAAGSLSPRAVQGQRIRTGSIVRLIADANGNWQITQLPQVESALVSMTPQDGAIRALVGGFDFNQNKFNHITQAWRQPGSTFKPFIYSAALDKGLGPATIINDAPLHFPAGASGGQAWDPKDDDQPDGPMTMRLALQKSKNLVSIRILSYIGTRYAQNFVAQRFGFDVNRTPPYLPMALGAGQVTPLQLAGAYSVFANGGYRINPYLVAEVTDSHGQKLSRAQPVTAGKGAPQAISPPNAYIMNSLLHSVATAGTGAGTNGLHRDDLQGKTGTTNDAKDGWFAGYQQSLVAVAWMGYDQPKSLGNREFGAQLALPIWVEYMQRALRNVPQAEPAMPDGAAKARGELFYSDKLPGQGFVASLGASASRRVRHKEGSPGDADRDGTETPRITPSEKGQIIDLFQSEAQ
ncbi:penicillin-binding protein 1A [Burkholderia stagnalis]|uniref:penicillin-binding protein 1A n=1 Tax=Burkholderia stagnalis TaxID=1503054 RepID=UPI001F49892B|nr:penicillin-binding protein 1A [Burkholderia stagnalis]